MITSGRKPTQSTAVRRSLLATVAVTSLFGVAACGGDTAAQTESDASATTVQVEDNNGTQTISVPPQSVVATDNRTFQTLDDWGVELSAGAVALMPETVSYTQQEDIVDLGMHREPDLEAVVAAEPDLIINGQRFAQYADEFTELAPDATVLDVDPREGEPLAQELKRQTTALGTIFEHETEAEELNTALDEAIARVKDSYDPQDTVMAVITSGGDIGYSAPGNGRTLGPLFPMLELTPALEVDDSSHNHQGDDVSVEAIAAADPDWLLVMDRDAAISADEPEYEPAAEVLEDSPALEDVSAIEQDQIVYMPADTYLNEGIQTYTEYLNSFAEALESAQ
ncbi:MAG TPA: ABC transporter substrate-binding protein [Ruania sp.]|nr:ABC transporter substrate-binding protein [Ruania sp.]